MKKLMTQNGISYLNDKIIFACVDAILMTSMTSTPMPVVGQGTF